MTSEALTEKIGTVLKFTVHGSEDVREGEVEKVTEGWVMISGGAYEAHAVTEVVEEAPAAGGANV